MKLEQTPITSVVTFPVGKFRSYPAEIGSSAPLDPVRPPRRIEFPQEQTLTAPELGYLPAEAVYVAIPPIAHPPRTAAAPAEAEKG